MSRDNFYSHQHRSRSRSFSAYRYNSGRHHDRRQPSPGPPVKFRKRSESPPQERYRHQHTRSPSPVHRNGGHRNGHKSRSPEVAHERSRRQRSSSGVPEPSSVLGVFGLHVRTSEGEIRDIFERFGHVDKIHMVFDAKSRSFRGYCFIYYAKQRDATAALNETNGLEVKERRIRVDYSKTKRAHTPTPGMYRGKRGQRNRSLDRPRPPRRDFEERRYRGGDDYPRQRSRERFDRSHRDTRDIDRSDGMRHRPSVRRRSMEREFAPRGRSPRRDSFRRRDRS